MLPSFPVLSLGLSETVLVSNRLVEIDNTLQSILLPLLSSMLMKIFALDNLSFRV